MEKDVAVREWCIEKAIGLLLSNKTSMSITTDDVVEVAKKIEDYIVPKETKAPF